MEIKVSDYNIMFEGSANRVHLFNSCTRALVTLDERSIQAYRSVECGRPIDDSSLLG